MLLAASIVGTMSPEYSSVLVNVRVLVNSDLMTARFFTETCAPFFQSVGNDTAIQALEHGIEDNPWTMSPLFRQLGCKPADWQRAPGRGRTVLVVGLRDEYEMLSAVHMGYVAIGFEPMPASITAMASRLSRLPLAVRSRVRMVSATYNESSDTWRWPPLMPRDVCWADRATCYNASLGFAYIVHAAVDSHHHTVRMKGTVGGGNNIAGTKGTLVPAVTLDTFLPAWANPVHMLQIDSQGWELPVLQGARAWLKAGNVHRIVFEFSPWLMERHATGHPIELLELLPSFGAICYDATGNFNRFPRPSTPFRAFLDSLSSGKNCDPKFVYYKKHCPGGSVQLNDQYGPYEDIICRF